ncbi:phosphoribosylglycinamide formyltransferase [Pseudoclavibacter sp. VKM Ac-2867]|uniref:phosphoribosylglycinamide formyltransferase n=1 Tax=Pseudoclavibacter sp. VKM Ac-2867 TaxID=2783829 RepID=UPI00188C8717|nr:phosphoribosylglycinamide formyltransferase [Pseudoclavibacter sp. VKM Ac-2867]MBF4457613.1 phosphoribosylglycinamide formyltransferase [Pseudoclavibacter sp. VKM Ac-2867]
MLKVVVLISGAGSNLQALLETLRASADSASPIGAEIVAIGADRNAAGLALAQEFGIPSFVVRPKDFADREAWGVELLAQIQSFEPDLTLLSGFMRLVPPAMVDALAPRLLNTHPAYLPEFPGAHAVRDALDAGVAETGASIIIVDNGVDTGPIVDRVRIPVLPGDTEELLHGRIKVAERRLLEDTVRGVASGEIALEERANA